MTVLFVVLPLALLVAAAAVAAFIWAVRSGQFDDLETPAVRMLVDDPDTAKPGAARMEREASATRDEPSDSPDHDGGDSPRPSAVSPSGARLPPS